MYIDGNMIVEYMQESASGFDWTTLIAPGLTFVIGVITVLGTYINTNKNNSTIKQIEKDNHHNNNELMKKQNEFMEELKYKELNANIIAQARINWLQEVREINVQFIKSCYDLTEDKMKNGTIGKSDRITKFDNEFWRLYYTLVFLYPIKGEGDNLEIINEQNKNVIERADMVINMIFWDTGKTPTSKENYYISIANAIEVYASTVSEYSKKEWQKIKKL